jgi:heterotetrameric sarcosine oxidase gamma subunit
VEPDCSSTQEPPRLTVLAPLRVLAVRLHPAADSNWISALHGVGVMRPPLPGRFEGDAVRVVWCGPTDYWLVTQQAALLDAMAQALQPGAAELVCAIDHSAGTVGIDLQGNDIDGLLARLMDATAIPAGPGQAARVRCADLAVVVLRVHMQRAWLLVERPVAHFLCEWLRNACERAGSQH